MVRRIYVEKKPPLRQEAAALLSELQTVLGLNTLTGLRLMNRYDVEGLSEDVFRRAVRTVFSEPQASSTWGSENTVRTARRNTSSDRPSTS